MVLGRRGGKLQISLWDTSGTAKITLPFHITRITDMFGKSLDVTPTLTVSQDPIYLEAIEPNMVSLPTRPIVTLTDLRALKQPVQWPLPGMDHSQASLKPGDYAGFLKVDDQWQLQPVTLVLPLTLSEMKLIWPTDSQTPLVQVTLQSNISDRMQSAKVQLADQPGRMVQMKIPANAMRQVQFPIKSFTLGSEQQTTVSITTDSGNPLQQTLDWTPMLATSTQDATDWVNFTSWAPFGKAGDKAPADDCQAKTQIYYGDAGLNIKVRVIDDEHHQQFAQADPQRIWAADSIQLALDMDVLKPWQAGVVGSGLAGHRVYEFSIGGNGDLASPGVVFCNRSYDAATPINTVIAGIHAKVNRQHNVTTYDILIPWEQVGVQVPMKRGDVIGFALAVNDIDPSRKAGRHGLRLFKGIVQTKDAKLYGKVYLH